MDDWVAFLSARLAEDADLATACGCDGEWAAHGHTVDFCVTDLPGFVPRFAEHVTRHDPARVLREVAAKRRVLKRHAPGPRGACRADGSRWPCAEIRDLAAPFADHPDFPRRY
ncbi:DUF6221 family protein [Actinokineospora globicatena]|uniref:Uncharacterized protein n=1 Tax=Actinokineospora globicatena TaxID=103729 RepID=A0A9W6QM62_9PSEU|nr:DUF6221 family protein [Actinokineospora globicatena]GLW90853.1 hypothetical protein Aglo03_16690 [Actinokineospora globicatena]